MTLAKVMARALHLAVPEATDDQIHHQLEYLSIQLDMNTETGQCTTVLRGATYNEEPTFLHAFYGQDDKLTAQLTEAVQEWYDIQVSQLTRRVVEVGRTLANANVKPESLWLPRRYQELLPHQILLGLELRFHDYPDEFVCALTFGRAFPLPPAEDIDLNDGTVVQ
jgi:hypothetical protein